MEDEAKPLAPFEITDDLIRDLDTGKTKWSDIPKDERPKVRDHIQAMQEAQDKDPEAEPTPAANAEQKDKPATTPESAKKPFDLNKLREAVISESTEANRAEQLARNLQTKKEKREAAERKLKELREKPAALPTDALGDEHQAKQAKSLEEANARIAALEEAFAERDQTDIAALETEINREAEDGVFKELEDAQKRYEPLQTKTPLRELNQRYATWLDSLVEKTGVKTGNEKADPNALRVAALDKWHADPELQKSMPQIEEMDKLDYLLALHQRKVTKGGDIRGHLLVLLEDQGTLDSIIKREKVEAAKDATSKTITALTKPDSEISTLSPTDGSGGGAPDAGMTVEKANAIIKASDERLRKYGRQTPEQRAQNRAAISFLAGATT